MMTAELQDALLHLHQLDTALGQDVAFAMELRGPSDSRPEPKRTYVRAVFALVEGMTAAYKRLALAEQARGTVTFSPAELALLRGVSYELTDAGDAVERRRHVGFSSRVKLGLKAVARAVGSGVTADFSTDGWDALHRGSRIRNRIMHPCTAADLELSAEDLETVAKGLYWFWAEFGRVTALPEHV
jgi:hypothetical protein